MIAALLVSLVVLIAVLIWLESRPKRGDLEILGRKITWNVQERTIISYEKHSRTINIDQAWSEQPPTGAYISFKNPRPPSPIVKTPNDQA